MKFKSQLKQYLKPKLPAFTFLNMMVMLASLAVIFSTIMPTDYYLQMPGSVIKLSERVSVGRESDKNSFYAVTVKEIHARMFHLFIEKMSSRIGLYPMIEDVDLMQGAMEESRDTAILFSSRRRRDRDSRDRDRGAGYRPYYGALVVALDPGSPTPLQPGDIIIKAGERRIRNHFDLQMLILQSVPGTEIELLFVRPPEYALQETVVTVEQHGRNRTLGIELHEYEPETGPDHEITVNMTDIVGGSAGLMLSLEIMNQQSETDLTCGYRITGTGFLTRHGDIHPAEGIKYKIFTAERADMDYFLCAADNYGEARKYAKTVAVVPVKTIECAEKFLDSLKPVKTP